MTAPERISISPTYNQKRDADYYLVDRDAFPGKGTEYIRADISQAAIAAAIEMAAKRNELTVRSIKEALDYREWEAAREIAMKGPPAIRALATPAQTDALEAVRLEAEQAGYERGVREAARHAASATGDIELFNSILALLKPTAQEDAP